jgi:hypothetical protein
MITWRMFAGEKQVKGIEFTRSDAGDLLSAIYSVRDPDGNWSENIPASTDIQTHVVSFMMDFSDIATTKLGTYLIEVRATYQDGQIDVERAKLVLRGGR